MTTVEAKIPDSLYQQVKLLAERESITVDQLIAIALASQVSSWMTKDYLEERARRGNWDDALKVLSNVPDREPEEHDKL